MKERNGRKASARSIKQKRKQQVQVQNSFRVVLSH